MSLFSSLSAKYWNLNLIELERLVNPAKTVSNNIVETTNFY